VKGEDVQLKNIYSLTLIFVIFTLTTIVRPVADDDKHSGYYYPKPQSTETYVSPLPVLESASKRTRVGFTVGLNTKQVARAYAPGYHIFAKGGRSEKLIIIATEEYRYNTLYRLRALMAALTSSARTSPLFTDTDIPEQLNFLDLLKLAGFTQVTISNGKDVTHQIFIV